MLIENGKVTIAAHPASHEIWEKTIVVANIVCL